jgi:hypothetical protein
LSHGTCSYIRMYINATANNVMLYLQHNFCNIIFKIKYELYIASGSAPPPPKDKFWVRTCNNVFPFYCRPTYVTVSKIKIEHLSKERQQCILFIIIFALKHLVMFISSLVPNSLILFHSKKAILWQVLSPVTVNRIEVFV